MVDGDAANLARRGMDATMTLVRRLGLRADEPAVLSSRGNLLVRFPAASVVARVATLTARTRRSPFMWLAREVAVARLHLRARRPGGLAGVDHRSGAALAGRLRGKLVGVRAAEGCRAAQPG